MCPESSERNGLMGSSDRVSILTAFYMRSVGPGRKGRRHDFQDCEMLHHVLTTKDLQSVPSGWDTLTAVPVAPTVCFP